MNPRQDGQVASTSLPSLTLLPHRIEFHLSRESSSSFNESSFKALNTSNPDASQFSNFNSEDHICADVKFHAIVRRIGAGLENLGNTCFLNSVLQCLTYTEPLVAYLQSGKHQNSCLSEAFSQLAWVMGLCISNPALGGISLVRVLLLQGVKIIRIATGTLVLIRRVNGFCALCAIQRHVTRALQLTGKVLTPKELVSNLRRTSRNFRTGRQEDAHEYMVHLLEAMHKCCLPSGVPSESLGSYGKSLVHKIFGGCLRSQVRCLQCSYCSDKFDPFLDLSLEIVKAHSLEKALANFTAREQLDGGERQYQCPQCKQKVQALKQLTIDKVPYVLMIHLKRFGSHASGQKIDKKVQFGSTLNLKPFVSGSYACDLNYTLYGVLVHAGWSTHSGHYYCFVRTSSGMWYSLDDSRVIQVSERTVLEQKAYMLFYMREGMTSAPENIANGIQISKMFPTSMQNGSNYISATSQTLGNSSMDRPSSVVLQKDITPVANGLRSTSITPQELQNKSASGFVNFVKKDKPMTPLLPNGSCATKDVSQGHPKRSADEDLGAKLRDKMSANKGNDVNASAAIVQDNLPNAPTDDDGAVLKSCDSLSSNYRSCKTDLLGVGARPSKYATDAATEIVPKSCDKAGLPSNAFGASSQKLKKKVMKYKVASMHLSARMLCRGSLSLHRRKKHKKMRKYDQCSVVTSIVDEDTEASTSRVRMKGADGAISAAENCPSELEKGIAFGGAGDDQVCKAPNTPITPKQQQDAQSSHLISKTVVNKGTADSPRNFKLTGVGRWDDVELGSSPSVGLLHTNRNVSIGYVPDEWDEEYDRGKRKKIRTSKFSFDGGPNPFQEVATKAAKSEARRKGHSTLPVNTSRHN